jgi:hypothetical protein
MAKYSHLLVGFESTMKGLNVELEKIKGRCNAGLIEAAILIRRSTETTPPLTPVDTGNLRASWFVTTAKSNVAESETGSFKGKTAANMRSEHTRVITESKSLIAANLSRKGEFIVIGYSANYALFVHEMLGAAFQRPQAGPKWFQAALERNRGEIVRKVAERARIR